MKRRCNKEHALRVVLQCRNTKGRIGGFHQKVCSTKSDGHEVVVSSGFACGNLDLYVSIDGKRVIDVSCEPLILQAIDKALDMVDDAAQKEVGNE